MAETVNAEIILVYIVGTLAMILLAGGIFFFFITYQKRLLKKELEINKIKTDQQQENIKNTVQAQEKERKRIAQDLHDEVGAMLSVVKLNINRLEKKSSGELPKNLAQETKGYIDDVITQVRRISRALLPPSLEKLGLYNAIEELAKWVNKSNQIQVSCFKTGNIYRLDIKKEMAAFRIVQELINNALKHSEASEIIVKTKFSENYLAISVTDNGVGFDINNLKETGLGLKNLESRSELIDAKFKMNSALQKGTSAVLLLNTYHCNEKR